MNADSLYDSYTIYIAPIWLPLILILDANSCPKQIYPLQGYPNADFFLITLVFLVTFCVTLFAVSKSTLISKEMKDLNVAFEWFISGFKNEGVGQLNYSICQRDFRLGHLLCGMFGRRIRRVEQDTEGLRSARLSVRGNWSHKYYWFQWLAVASSTLVTMKSVEEEEKERKMKEAAEAQCGAGCGFASSTVDLSSCLLVVCSVVF